MNIQKESIKVLGVVQPIKTCKRKLFMSGVNKHKCAFNKSSPKYCEKCMPCMYNTMWSIIKNIDIEALTPEYWDDLKSTRNYLIELDEDYVVEEIQQTLQTLKNTSIFMGDYTFLKSLQINKNFLQNVILTKKLTNFKKLFEFYQKYVN